MALDEIKPWAEQYLRESAVVLTEKSSELLRWMASGPVMARIIGKFPSVLDKTETVSQLYHHEDQPGD